MQHTLLIAAALCGLVLVPTARAQDLYVGSNTPSNTLDLTNGTNSFVDTYIGFQLGADSNTLNVLNPGALLTNSNYLYVGYEGSGNSLVISNGGTVRNTTGTIGNATTASNNSVLVSGSGSLWTNSGALTVGNSGSSASLTIADGGTVAASGITIAASNGSSGTLNIGRLGGEFEMGGTIIAPTIAFGDGTGVINFNQRDALTITSAISGAGTLNIALGTTTLSGANTYSGTTTIGIGYPFGVLVLGSAQALGGGGGISFNGGTLQYSAANTNDYSARITNSVYGMRIDTAGQNVTWATGVSAAQASDGLAKLGAGTLTLAGANTYGGETIVEGGELAVTGSIESFSRFYVGYESGGNSIVISNGGTVASKSGVWSSIIGYYHGSNSGLVTGAGSLWTNSLGFYVGFQSSGNSLVISNGGTVANRGEGGIGNLNRGSNSVLVTGAGSLWTNSGYLGVGLQASSNSMVISNGGTVAARSSGIGGGIESGTSNNSVLVTGNGSLWTNSSDIVVGHSSHGNSLVISNGGVVASYHGFVSYYFSSYENSVLVTGAGSLWTNTGDLYIGYLDRSYPGNNSLVISNGGAVVNATSYIGYDLNYFGNNSALITGEGSLWMNKEDLYVGHYGHSSSLVISNGGTVEARTAYVGYFASSATALVTGAGSHWTNSADLYIGYGGYGESIGYGNSITVADAGTVASARAYIGFTFESKNASALITGSGSLWTNSSELTVGYSGSGTSLTIADGGTVAASGLTIAASNGSSGTLNIGRFGTNDTGGTIIAPTIAFGTGTGAINFNQSDAVTITSAISGAGTLNQLGAGTTTLSGANTYSGDTTIEGGELVVRGSISNNALLYVGNEGSGSSLVISNGGTVANSRGVIGNVSSASNNSVLVTGAGSLWTNSDSLYVGPFGSGHSLVISNGGKVAAGGGNIGRSNNSVLVTGTNSLWTNSRGLSVGLRGNGNSLTVADGGLVSASGLYVGYGYQDGGSSNSLIITNGGTVLSGDSYIGYGEAVTASNNRVLVTGPNSLWTNSGNLVVGFSDTNYPSLIVSGNSLVISNGGTVRNSEGFIGATIASNNSVLVTGENSLWANTRILFVGERSAGNSLVISNGGTVANSSGFIGRSANSSNNSVLVTGVGSLWTNSGQVRVGSSGSGNNLTIADGGTVAASSIAIAVNVGSSGTLNIGSFGGSDTAGTIISPTIDFVAGTGAINFNQSDAVTITSAISGAGTLNQLGGGTTVLSGANTYTGTTAISAGTMVFQSATALYGGSNALWTAANIIVSSNATAAFGVGGVSGFTASDVTTLLDNLTTVNNNGLQAGSSIGFDTTGGNFTLTNNIANSSGTGGGSLGLTKLGLGTLTLSGSNSYSGGTKLIGGTLTAGNLYAFGTGAVTVGLNTFLDMANYSIANTLSNNGGTILNAGTISGGDFTGGTTDLSGNNSTVAEVTGTATVNVSGTGTTITNVSGGTVNVNGASTTIQSYNGGNVAVGSGLIVAMNDGNSPGVISGDGGMTKNSAGTLTLGGVNTYTGATTVSAGQLIVDGSIASSPVTIQSGGTLGGSGTVGAVTVQSGGTINPGNSPGTLNINGNIDWLGGGNYNWQVLGTTNTPGHVAGTTWDLITVTGALDLTALTPSSKFNLNLWSLSSTAPDTNGPITNFNSTTSYEWLAVSASSITGFNAAHFAVNVGATNGTGGFGNPLDGGYLFGVRQDGGNLYVTYGQAAPIPEPGTWAAAALLFGGAAYVRWRKRAKVS